MARELQERKVGGDMESTRDMIDRIHAEQRAAQNRLKLDQAADKPFDPTAKDSSKQQETTGDWHTSASRATLKSELYARHRQLADQIAALDAKRCILVQLLQIFED
jgi:hypothetical protein